MQGAETPAAATRAVPTSSRACACGACAAPAEPVQAHPGRQCLRARVVRRRTQVGPPGLWQPRELANRRVRRTPQRVCINARRRQLRAVQQGHVLQRPRLRLLHLLQRLC